MFWDAASVVYDVFAKGINRRVNRRLCAEVAALTRSAADVLECACGTGMLTEAMAPGCGRIVATDYSAGMLRRARRKCRRLPNVTFRQGNILRLDFASQSFDAVVAGNVLHLLDDPRQALAELLRVCRPGGRVILPTYVLTGKRGLFMYLTDKFGAHFKRRFTPDTYRRFFEEAGHTDGQYLLIEGRLPCAVAILPVP